MSAPLIAFLFMAFMVIGVMLGSYLLLILPDEHTQADSRDILTITSTGMMATLIALITGLLVTSAKSNFDVRPVWSFGASKPGSKNGIVRMRPIGVGCNLSYPGIK